MTTDTYSKECAVSCNIGGKEITIGGMAKGSGMIHPNMATLICVVTTDASISKELLQEALSEDVKYTFNMISVDRDTSTNDSLLILANGKAGNEEITEKNEDYHTFCKALNTVTTKLAKMIAADGEGATKLIEVTVKGAGSREEAAALSKSIISSNLVKAAVFGNDANWEEYCVLWDIQGLILIHILWILLLKVRTEAFSWLRTGWRQIILKKLQRRFCLPRRLRL